MRNMKLILLITILAYLSSHIQLPYDQMLDALSSQNATPHACFMRAYGKMDLLEFDDFMGSFPKDNNISIVSYEYQGLINVKINASFPPNGAVAKAKEAELLGKYANKFMIERCVTGTSDKITRSNISNILTSIGAGHTLDVVNEDLISISTAMSQLAVTVRKAGYLYYIGSPQLPLEY